MNFRKSHKFLIGFTKRIILRVIGLFLDIWWKDTRGGDEIKEGDLIRI